MTAKWLVGDTFFDMASATRFWGAALAELWPQSAGVIRTGRRSVNFYDWLEAKPDLSTAFQRMNMTSAKLIGDTVAKKLDLPASAARLLDVGGGHGLFTIILCQLYPKLQATILDSPEALNTAREMVVQHGLSERIELLEGDIWQVQWGQGYDSVLLFNLLHHFDLDTNKKLLNLAAGALNPGGRVAILEQVEGKVNGSAANAFVRLIALQYYLFVDGRVYSAAEISQMLAKTGFSAPRFHSLTKAPGTSLALATKNG
jgi:cyclopropane fatty-acyl-phospholipid synthase-like methyltransferase